METEVQFRAGKMMLEGQLVVPEAARGIVLFAHGSGSSRFSVRNRHVAQRLQAAGFATLLFDLLTAKEEQVDDVSGRLRFDIPFLAERLREALRWVRRQPATAALPCGYFGASTGAAAALVAAALDPEDVYAVVSRGGRPDLADEYLERVRAATLLIVGGDDEAVIPLNESAYARLGGVKRLEIVLGATHLFEEPGALERVADLAVTWFRRHLPAAVAPVERNS